MWNFWFSWFFMGCQFFQGKLFQKTLMIDCENNWLRWRRFFPKIVEFTKNFQKITSSLKLGRKYLFLKCLWKSLVLCLNKKIFYHMEFFLCCMDFYYTVIILHMSVSIENFTALPQMFNLSCLNTEKLWKKNIGHAFHHCFGTNSDITIEKISFWNFWPQIWEMGHMVLPGNQGKRIKNSKFN